MKNLQSWFILFYFIFNWIGFQFHKKNWNKNLGSGLVLEKKQKNSGSGYENQTQF